MDFECDLSSALVDMGQGAGFELKKEQVEALSSLYVGKDTVCLLNTGYGKSMIFQLTPFLFNRKYGTDRSITLVLTPLNSIMEDQVKKLSKRGIKACYMNMLGSSGQTYHFRSAVTGKGKII